MKEAHIHFPPAFSKIFHPAPYKLMFGGRGSSKSWTAAGALILNAYDHKELILCAREFQNSISDSVHPLLVQRIIDFGLREAFKITDRQITCLRTGSTFKFAGLHNNPSAIRSFEGCTKCWVEEAQRISTVSLRHLIPTIFRQKNIPSLVCGPDGKRLMGDCELWATLNPENELDPIWNSYIKPNIRPDNAPDDWKPARPDWWVKKINWDQNPYFPRGLDEERRFMMESDFEAYQHVWEGDILKIGAAIVFGTRIKQDGSKEPLVHVECFESPEAHDAMFYFGADFGFANDPSCLIRCFLKDNCLYIDHEWWGLHIELNDLPFWWATVPLADKWPIYCDCSAPATISQMSNAGFNALPAEKWPGSVEDGIRALKSFKRIVVHERCVHTAQEFRLYRYRVDKNEVVLPILEPGNDHTIDSCIAEGSLITTKRGQVPIEQVVPGDLAMTRHGWRLVTKLHDNGVKEVRELVAGDKRLWLTPDHEVFTIEKGFARADTLRYDDQVLIQMELGQWLRLRLSNLMGAAIGATPKAITRAIDAILRRLTLAGRRLLCTAILGNFIEGQLRKATTFTEHRALMTKRELAWSAGPLSWLIDILGTRLVPVHAVLNSDVKTAKVYDLTVEEHPEFIANGIVSLDCRYALWEWIKEGGEGAGLWEKYAAFHGIT